MSVKLRSPLRFQTPDEILNYYLQAARVPQSMKLVNRSALMIMPAQPFLDWLHQVDPTSGHLTLTDLRQEAAIYLLPECENMEEALEGLRGDISTIFEEQLDGWYRAPAMWPKPRDRRTFLSWFECSFHSMIFDLGRDRLRHEKL